jgi:ATP-dependent DNA helicase RecG
VSAAEFDRMPLIEPVYPLTEGLSAKVLAKAIAQALEKLPELPEWQDQAFLQRHGWPSFSRRCGRCTTRNALRHRPRVAARPQARL